MNRIPDELKPLQARRERLAMAALGGAKFFKLGVRRMQTYRNGELTTTRPTMMRKAWFYTLPTSGSKGPYATKWEAVEDAILHLMSLPSSAPMPQRGERLTAAVTETEEF